MRRKVNLVGESTLTVSLPSAWIKKNNLQKGNELSVSEFGPNLLISPILTKPKCARKARINIKGFNTLLLNRFLDEFYRSGIEEIELIDAPEQIYFYMDKKYLNFQKYIDIILNRYMGMELIKKEKNVLTIQFLLKEGDHKQIESINLRVYFLIKELIREFKGSLEIHSNFVKRANEYHDSITKFILYYSRLLNNSDMPLDRKLRLFQFFSILDILIGKIRPLSKKLADLKKINKKTEDFLKKILDMFEEQLDIVYKKTTVSKIEDLIKNRYSLVNILESQKFDDSDWKIISEGKIFLDLINYFCLTYVSVHLEEFMNPEI